jgi:hypothetical protein
MAVRHATRRYPDVVSLLRDWEGTLKLGALLLPPDALDGEPAPEMRIDVVLPSGKRVGPIAAQLVNRYPDGSAAMRLPEMPDEIGRAAAEAADTVEKVRAWLLERKVVGPPGGTAVAEVDALKGRIAELEQRLTRAEQGRQEALRAAAAGGSAASSSPVVTGRGYVLPDLSGPPGSTGALGDTSLRDHLMGAAVEKATGLLTLRYPDGSTRWGFWSKGGTVGWRAEPIREDEVLGMLLFRANQLTKDQLAQSVEVMEKRGCRQGDALIELGLLTFAQLVLLLQKQAEFVLQRILADKEGTWAWHPFADLPERFVAPPVRVAAVLFRNLRQRTKEMASDTLTEILRAHLDHYVFIKPGVERTFEEMRLSADEQGFLKIIGSTSYRLREVPSVSNLTRSATASMVWCLDELGLLEFRKEEADKRGQDRVARILLSKKAVTQKGTMFDRLDLHWICTTAEVEAAWQRAELEFPAQNPAKYGEEWRATCEFIRKGIEEAYQRLRNENTRREYRLTVIERAMADQSAQMLAGKGDMALVKDQWREAWDCFSKAVELAPTNATYKAGMAKAEAALRRTS